MKKILLVIFFILLSTVILIKTGQVKESTCITCHVGIESISPTHDFDCGVCHGGDSSAKDKNLAHKDMLGGKNPASHEAWDQTCANCHEYQVRRVKSNIMFTNTGIIKNTMLAWGEEYNKHYAVMADAVRNADGQPVQLEPVAELDTVAAELYRKFCGSCHVTADVNYGWMTHKSSGCSVCHTTHNERGIYTGEDVQMQGLSVYPEEHVFSALPEDRSCELCHNRSGRISLSYRGAYDGNNSLVPTKYGEPGPVIHSDVRNIRSMPADIHHDGGMECIDCHTSYEIMGDGYSYENMYHQLEISCESCHGSGDELPATQTALRELNNAFTESINYKYQVPNGAEMVLTEKGRMFSNVYKTKDSYWLMKKRTGERLEVKTIKDTPEHNVTGHGRMECISCHSRVVIQCYGCHTYYDERGSMLDDIKHEETQGQFFEREDFRSFYPFPLALNQRGKVSPVTPGCQTFFNHIDKDGQYLKKDYVLEFRKTNNLKFAPFYGHNTGKKAVTCVECHNDPFFYGFGNALFSSADGTFMSPLICDICDVPLNSMSYVKGGVHIDTADVVRENSRIFTGKEISKIIDAGRCIICHDKADDKYYSKEIDYEKVLSDFVHAPLLR